MGFSDYPTCVDVSRVTAAPDRLDVLIGFGGSGDIMWFGASVQRLESG